MGLFPRSKPIEEPVEDDIEQALIDKMKKALIEVNNAWAECRKYGFNVRPWIDWTSKKVEARRTYYDSEKL